MAGSSGVIGSGVLGQSASHAKYGRLVQENIG